MRGGLHDKSKSVYLILKYVCKTGMRSSWGRNDMTNHRIRDRKTLPFNGWEIQSIPDFNKN